MRVLGLESSCDETAAALVVDGVRVLGDSVASQVAIHAEWGGVVPEIASRHHVTNLIPVVRAALAWARGLPLVGVNHLEGHLSAVWLDEARGPRFPHLALLVSGGHSELVVVHDHGSYELIGATRDDAAGEAFDKVGKMLGLGYPAGPIVDKLAATGDPTAYKLPRAMRGRGLDFSFSGLKTAAQTILQKQGIPQGQALNDLCASFQAAILDQLIGKTELALNERKLKQLQVAGGVAANRGLRAALAKLAAERGVELFVPPPNRCTDNAAMIAGAGYWRLARGERADLTLNATPSLPLDATPAPAPNATPSLPIG